MIEDTILTALSGARTDGCDEDTATVFAVCAVLAEQPDLALSKIIDAIEGLRHHHEAKAV